MSFDIEGSEINGQKQTVEQLVFGTRIVGISGTCTSPFVSYCVKTLDQDRGNTIAVYVHSCDTLRNTRMTLQAPGNIATNAVVLTEIPHADSILCYLQGGQLWNMHLSGGCSAPVTAIDREIEGYKIFVGDMNRIWLLAVLNIPSSPQSTTGSAMIFDSLMIRHWDNWSTYSNRNHLFLFELKVSEDGLLVHNKTTEFVDVMKDIQSDCPGNTFQVAIFVFYFIQFNSGFFLIRKSTW